MRDTCVQNKLVPAPDASLAEIAWELRIIDHRLGWSRTLAIGELILKHFFNDDIREWRTHRSDKNESIRRLAQRSDCPLSRSALSEAVAVYVAFSDLPSGSFRDELSPSHLAATLKICPSERAELLEMAIAGRWTVRELRARVSEHRRNGGERRGRPRSSPPCAALTYLRNAALIVARAAELLNVPHPIDPDVLRQLQALLQHVDEQMAGVRLRIDKLSAGPRVTLTPRVNKVHLARDEPKRAVG